MASEPLAATRNAATRVQSGPIPCPLPQDGEPAMSTMSREAPDALLRRLADLALTRARSTKDTVERISWLNRYNDFQTQAAELAGSGDD